jgi:hypothetical protein
MTPGDEYRARAAELRAKAQGDAAPAIQHEYENLALAYLRLAAQADRNSQTDVVYEHAPDRPRNGTNPQSKPISDE